MHEIRTYAVLDGDGLVDNVILWDGGDGWTAPDGTTVTLCPEGVGPGWRRDGQGWQSPDRPSDE